ncbi:aldose epimerase family protein [Asticcacaulis sp. 201]|uniref:aldose epimerase family protein n=1 Tax=Asticcacaulis sp. 201 TaxID=3028787 RepID=UPI0029160645|nr:aldose epimerase family protein [Asticcacaulis sp. 201]MDV6330879.1 aldose epimerase family protein [Asticcacaulis sp. 201]
MTSPVFFGRLADGQVVHSLTLAAPGGLHLEVMTYGATIRSLKTPSATGLVETLIGFETLSDYEADKTYQACIIGRTVNRLRKAAFTHGDGAWRVTPNEGPNHLHGGACGLSRRVWQADARPSDEAPIVLRYVSPAGEEGYPGNLAVETTLSLPLPTTLQIDYRAVVDAPCPIDLTHHLYFNLDQAMGGDISSHVLGIQGDEVLEVDDACLATGLRLPVTDTLFDLRHPTALSDVLAQQHPQLTNIGLNQSWVLERSAAPAATLYAPKAGLGLALHTDQPCLQAYAGLSRDVAAHGAIALEPQGFIDAVNQPAFPSPWLAPGQVYHRTSQYRFQHPSQD